MEFVREKESWLRQQQSHHVPSVKIEIGETLPILGQDRLICTGQGRRVVMDEARIYVPGDAATAPRRLLGHLKQIARSELATASDIYAAKLGKPYARLSIRDTRSRWGSCSSEAGLMYSWRLIMAPPSVLNYVAAHEVAHLSEMNHSSDFWQLVQNLYGDFEDSRAWLRESGHELHRYQFGD